MKQALSTKSGGQDPPNPYGAPLDPTEDLRSSVPRPLSQAPPSQVLFKFLYLLDQSMLDIAEEAELAKHKANIVKEIRHNQQLEQEMNEMDIKIGEQGVYRSSVGSRGETPVSWDLRVNFLYSEL